MSAIAAPDDRSTGHFTREFLDELRDHISLVDLISPVVKLRRAGREQKGLCPFHSEKSGSFTINEAKGFYHCFGCGAHGGAFDWMMEYGRLNFVDAVAELAVRAGMRPDHDGRTRPRPKPVARQSEAAGRAEIRSSILWARGVWDSSRPAAGTLAEHYLAGRGINISRPDLLPLTIRFHPALRYRHDDAAPTSHPAMVAAVQAVDRRVIGIHRTYLADHGSGLAGKADVPNPKRMAGKCWGGAIRLAAAADIIAIAEGIETGLSVMETTGLPVWVAGSLGNMAGGGDDARLRHPTRPGAWLPSPWPDMDRPGILLPDSVREVVLCADNDGKDPAAGRALMLRAERRFLQQGLGVRTVTPPPGMDFNDVLIAGALAPAGEKQSEAAA